MADPARRALERDASAGDPSASRQLLVARLRAGEVEAGALELAARLGLPLARAALGEGAPAPASSLAELAGALEACGRLICAHATRACAVAAGALRPSDDPFERETTARLMATLDAWLVDPSRKHQRRLADQDHDYLAWVANSYWLNALVVVATEPDWAAQTRHVLQTADSNGVSEEALAALRPLARSLLESPS
ncbi:MAG TPA: hypothetical protein DEA08_39495 [Planctomycetes bacterium]|nr:hypothetical protein [Planctomycetota bacterium]